jgi:hypothetical protein
VGFRSCQLSAQNLLRRHLADQTEKGGEAKKHAPSKQAQQKDNPKQDSWFTTEMI